MERSTGEERILGGEVRVLRATREPCVVCGHPTGDCKGDADPPKVVVGAGTFPSLGHEETYIVPEDVWEVRPITPFTTAKVLVAAKGTRMPMSEAEELGLL
jgi:hypothetical protein